MWVLCHVCNGNGFINKNNNTIECELCTYDIIPGRNIISRGRIWVYDNLLLPFTPPTSPRDENN